ncbi:MAG: hypothetical protein V2J26_05510 [Pacificimonas sp.]|jgi:hypothetical protein|nr:hypothetical protein [Pacificimonas sp.]
MSKQPKQKAVSLDSIYLDLENPRHEPYNTQAETIEYLCKRESILPLAKDIHKNGLNPLELFALIPASRDDDDETYFVAEGNRRICALKLLADPDLAPAKQRKSFEKLNADWDEQDSVQCVLFADRDDVDLWLKRIHDGEQGGIGRRKWDADQSQRHSGDPKNRTALAVLDYAEEHGMISADDRKGKLTTVQRYLTNKLVRDAMGIDASNPDDVSRDRSKADFDLLLAKFLEDLARGDVNSRAKKDQIEAYARELSSTDGQSHKRVEAEALKSPDKSTGKGGAKKPKPKKPRRKTRIQFEEDISDGLERLGSHKLPNLYTSICTVSVQSWAPLVSIGAWAFLESLSARAGRKTEQGFPDFYNKARLQKYGVAQGKGDKAIMDAIRRIANSGDVTKHDATAALFNGEQLANDMEKLRELILKTIEEAEELSAG